jgi:hypothetical protein
LLTFMLNNGMQPRELLAAESETADAAVTA